MHAGAWLPDFPDPDPDEGFDLDARAHPELDPDNTQFQEAHRECLPSGTDTNTSAAGSS